MTVWLLPTSSVMSIAGLPEVCLVTASGSANNTLDFQRRRNACGIPGGPIGRTVIGVNGRGAGIHAARPKAIGPVAGMTEGTNGAAPTNGTIGIGAAASVGIRR